MTRMNADLRPSAKSAVRFMVSCLCPYRRHHLSEAVRLGALVSVVVSAVVAAHAVVPQDAAVVVHVAAVAELPHVAVAVVPAVAAPPLVAAVVVPAVAVVLRLVRHEAAVALVALDVQPSPH